MPNANSHTSPTMPDTKTLVEDLGAIYPSVVYWSEEPATETPPEEGKLDPEVLDEEIFAHLVALR